MNARYKLVNWAFDENAFAASILLMLETFTKQEVGEIVDVTASCVDAWSKARYKGDHRHPNLTNLLIVCNHLDLDPRDFFSLEDS